VDELAQRLLDLRPALLAGSLALFWGLESVWPYTGEDPGRWTHAARNAAMGALALSVNFLLGMAGLWLMGFARARQVGLFNVVTLPPPVAVVLSVMLWDLSSYAGHRLLHRLPLFWRSHRVHHGDRRLDVTSMLRFHPFDLGVAGLFQCVVILILGMPPVGYALYYAIMVPLFCAQHAAVSFPRGLERVLRLVFSVPSVHRVHHASERSSANFGDLFTLWDRLFGTLRLEDDPRRIEYGVEELHAERSQSVPGMLRTPFEPVGASAAPPPA
jgi:sterol desaturase/sphingolipid hydroxylase (fatty acid hydroxylase superfamily)